MSLFEQLSLFRLPPVDPLPKARHVVIGGRAIAYELRQGANRRRLAITIDERGLRVGAPRHTTAGEIESFLLRHGEWILGKLEEFAQRRPRQLTIRDGMRLPLLGGEALVRVTAGANRIRWQDEILELAARPDADLDGLARRGFQRRALDHFRERIAQFAPLLGRPVPPLALTSARTRWGSCSAKSGIRLNWRLIHLPPACADYVIAHELAHLVEMNHSPRFWAVVEGLYPDWRVVRGELKRRGAALPLL